MVYEKTKTIYKRFPSYARSYSFYIQSQPKTKRVRACIRTCHLFWRNLGINLKIPLPSPKWLHYLLKEIRYSEIKKNGRVWGKRFVQCHFQCFAGFQTGDSHVTHHYSDKPFMLIFFDKCFRVIILNRFISLCPFFFFIILTFLFCLLSFDRFAIFFI